ncbi:hypothetical protein ACFW04_014179 [Cataglyphis niger]
MIFHDSGLTGASPVLAFQGNNVVVVRMGEVYLVSCYVSPNIPRGEFLEFVDELDDALAHSKNKILICGDFNSKSKLWGSPFSDERGTTIDEWAAASDLRLLNTGSDPTCIRAQGCSIIDLTWASPGLVRYISSWQVLDLSTLSDHVYIVVKFDNNRQVEYNQTKKKICRWNWKKADWEKFQDSLLWSCTSNLSNIEIEPDVDKIADTLDAEMKMACDNCAPKALPPQGKKSMYWWNDTIAETRADTNAAYRAWKRIRRIRNPNPHEEELSSCNILDNLDADSRRQLIAKLFPSGETHDPSILWEDWSDENWNDDWSVTPGEVFKVFKKRKVSGHVSPGPDGVPAKAWKRVPSEFLDAMNICFTACLKKGVFPTSWKRATLVLIPKVGYKAELNTLPKVRPICLLNETGKALERIIVDRMKQYMEENPCADLSPWQFGFREGKSTHDAINHVKVVAGAAMSEGGFTVGVSIDICNAFNSVPWSTIRQALINKRFPDYLTRIIDNYLYNRSIEYKLSSEKEPFTCQVTAGVPQGSVLGPCFGTSLMIACSKKAQRREAISYVTPTTHSLCPQQIR